MKKENIEKKVVSSRQVFCFSLLFMVVLIGCPSKTMESLKIKAKENIEKKVVSSRQVFCFSLLFMVVLIGCPSKTMESLKIKAKEKIEKADQRLAEKVEKL